MDPSALAKRLDDLQALDVRYPNEWEAGRIPGAPHIPGDDRAERVDELDRDRPVVTVCRSGGRSDRAAQFLREDGFDAENLDGGMQAWADAGLAYRAGDGAEGRVAEPEPPPDERPREMVELQDGFPDVILAAQEHFGATTRATTRCGDSCATGSCPRAKKPTSSSLVDCGHVRKESGGTLSGR